MLKQLKYKVTFRNPAKTLEGNYNFQTGMTAITGKNGKGKSFIMEMIQYLLHGTEALRGKADDYVELEGELDFELKGRDLRVTRDKRGAVLKELVEGTFTTGEGVTTEQGGVKNLASGTKAVNLKIAELFGYSSKVFRVANACNQGKIEELGSMLPAERKRLVDETIGLNVLDAVTEFIDGKRKDLNTGIKAIESILVAPVEPVNPNLPYTSVDYKAQRDALALERDQRNSLMGVANRVLVEPMRVDPHPEDGLYEQYQEEQATRASMLTAKSILDRELKAIPVYNGKIVTELEPDDAQFDQYMADLKALEKLDTEIAVNRRGLDKYKWTEPVLTWEEIEAYKVRNTLVDRWEAKMRLKAKNVPHDCPKCQHHWEDEDPRLKTEFADVSDECPGERTQLVVLVEAEKNRSNYESWTPLKAHLDTLVRDSLKYDGPKLEADIKRIGTTRAAIQESRFAQANEERRQDLNKKIADLLEGLQKTEDRSMVLPLIQKQRLEYAQYQTRLQAYNEQLEDQKRAQAELKRFPEELDQLLGEREASYITVLNYENNLEHYQKAKEAYDKAMEQLQALRDELQDWDNGRKAVVDLRAKVKGYLLPSLNSVASLLIQQMTGGELSWIVVNEDFDITVEGQRLETLSGAGKAVANLALRIGLGQVLTNRVFSVMMLDEIDASCDDDRAQYIAGCMMNLTKTIKQVIQVSHKAGLVADHHVRL